MDERKLEQELDGFFDNKLSVIAAKLPTLVHEDAASFACGYNMGYKQAILDLMHHLRNGDYFYDYNFKD